MAKRILEVFLGIHLIMALFQQWMIPSVQNSLIPFTKMDYMHLTERLLKLAVTIYTISVFLHFQIGVLIFIVLFILIIFFFRSPII